jgi:hypothetical protein
VYYASCPKATCDCPAPTDPNSTEVLDNCACISAAIACTACSAKYFYCSTPTYTCTCQNTCGYSCISPYVWDGAQCVLGAARKSMLGDGSSMIVNNA